MNNKLHILCLKKNENISSIKIALKYFQQLRCILCPNKSTKPPTKWKKGKEDEYEPKIPMAEKNILDLYIQKREEIVVNGSTQYMSLFACRCCFPFYLS